LLSAPTHHASRFPVLAEALKSTRENFAFPTVERLFRERGLPLAPPDGGLPIRYPHGMFQLSALLTGWLRIGIAIERIRPAHPQQNGRHEGLHLAPKQQATRLAGANFLQQQARFDAFVDEFKTERREALPMKYPKRNLHPATEDL
jgi:hypothetical protein